MKFRLLVLALVLVVSANPLVRIGFASGPPSSDPYSSSAMATKNYHGVTLDVLTLEKPVLGEPTELHARQFEKLTGAKVNVTHVAFDKFYQEVLLGLKQDKYDVVFYGSMWIADVLPYLEPIPSKMLNSDQYRDVLPHYKSIASWGKVPYQVPVDGDRHYLQYRKDLLENAEYRAAFKKQTGRELAVPKTWPELQEVARFFHGRKLGDGRVISGIAEVTVSDALLGNQFIKRAAPYAKHPNVKGGFYFDLKTMEPLINTPGFVKALEDFVAAQDLYPPGGKTFSFPQVIQSFGRGDAVFSDSWDDPFIQAMGKGNPLRNKVAAAISPGSRQVWNRKTGKWDNFPAVNYAPYIVYGWTSAVPRATPHKDAAFDFLGFFGNRENHASDLLVGRFGINPFRHSDLNKNFWVQRAGWNDEVAASYIQTLDRMNKSKNRVLDLRIHRGQEYVYLLSVGVYRALTGRESPQSALDNVAERWRQLTRNIGVEKQREAYRHLVHFEDNQ
ncbi:sugar ABC transporter substrate-binding protein [Geobacter sulfurreducens subsp. ethanolicus]|uniref:ABC transporter substrate-binding protein n=1 Tax=Geobacter sulfurreducens TaxID=35554 RepID=UPI0025736EB1|nr:extracellular solute-binding protein [Geobacter sulfurreducens]BEH08988.1 sugar ABC transporter substrate-binding protein [Geobacter sulfurreducens subsp. ethanolicus]